MAAENVPVFVGNEKALARLPAETRDAFAGYIEEHPTDTTLAVIVSGQLVLAISLNDTVRAGAVGAVRAMQSQGCAIEMLTGDVARAAAPVAKLLNLDAYHASLLPADKHKWITTKIAADVPTAMLGDGINDSTALAAASVGVAMGASGSALAARSADVVILSDNLERLPQTMELAKQAKRTIIFNIAFSALIKLVAVILALSGELKLWMAVLVDVGSLLVVLLVGMNVLAAKVWGEDELAVLVMEKGSVVEQDEESGGAVATKPADGQASRVDPCL